MTIINAISKLAANAQTIGAKEYDNGLPHAAANNGTLQAILQIVFGIAAALAVLMIVIAGFRFIAGVGNPQEVSKARSTILYAVIGLIVAISAEIIVSFTLGNL
ncbi:MAG: hypothetical protein WCK80_02040 [bacterium]